MKDALRAGPLRAFAKDPRFGAVPRLSANPALTALMRDILLRHARAVADEVVQRHRERRSRRVLLRASDVVTDAP